MAWFGDMPWHKPKIRALSRCSAPDRTAISRPLPSRLREQLGRRGGKKAKSQRKRVVPGNPVF